jgi:hypothetical protein
MMKPKQTAIDSTMQSNAASVARYGFMFGLLDWLILGPLIQEQGNAEKGQRQCVGYQADQVALEQTRQEGARGRLLAEARHNIITRLIKCRNLLPHFSSES